MWGGCCISGFCVTSNAQPLYIKSRALSARYTPIRSRFLWLHQCSASFLLCLQTRTALGKGGANTRAIVGPTPVSQGWLWHGVALPPVSPGWAVGSRSIPCGAQSQPWALLQLGLLRAGLGYQTDPSHRRGCRGNYQNPSWSWAFKRKVLSQPEGILARIWKCWGCPHHCTIKDAVCFSSCYTGRNIVWDPSTTNPLLDLQAPHEWNNREDKNMKNNNKGRAARWEK